MERLARNVAIRGYHSSAVMGMDDFFSSLLSLSVQCKVRIKKQNQNYSFVYRSPSGCSVPLI